MNSSSAPSIPAFAISRIQVGDQLQPFTRRTDFDNWNRYAGINDEFLPHSMNDEAARSEGFPKAFGMGNLQWSYLHSLLRQFIGPDGAILRIDVQYRNPNLREQTVTAYGTVTGIEGDTVSLDLWTQEAEGDRLAVGTARVRL
ncbi:MAG: hypothetical protein Q8L05_11690 [Actinomycetota bacterium]|nr:hypothetical protein [Actinomycetota bacterium]MDP2288600.1 hypothetical protein [Actinomycetota bacterium]